MLPKDTVLEAALARLERLPPGHALDLRTYKRNRSVLLRKNPDGTVLVLEDGYERQRFEAVSRDKLPKLLKTLLKREFPRSAFVRLYDLGEHDPDAAPAARRKVI
ncbi:MAG: hypothetical protein AB1916_00800 [Thermodesulfobacteriota bacterium]